MHAVSLRGIHSMHTLKDMPQLLSYTLDTVKVAYKTLKPKTAGLTDWFGTPYVVQEIYPGV